MRPVAVFVALSIAGCVVPVKRTDYDAVDMPWSKGTLNGSLTDCPPHNYHVGEKILVTAAYGHPGKILVYAWVPGDNQLKFVSWDLRLRSLADPQIEVTVPLAFRIDCTHRGGNVTFCAVPQDPKILFGGGTNPNGFPRTNAFEGTAEIPPEFVDGFSVLVPEVFDNASRIDSKPLRFELRTRVTTTGPMGC